MPIVPPALGNPYPSVNAVMDRARALVDDQINDASGDLLTNDAPYAQTYLSSAWEWYQEKCAAAGIETLIKETVLSFLPIQYSQDVADQAFISWLGCSDGVNQYDSPALPQDLIQPLSVWSRFSGNGSFCLMSQAEDGLPNWFNYLVYDWRDDGMFFFANPQLQDFRIRYSAYRPDLDITQPDSLIPMMRCANPLATRIAFKFASARGAVEAASLAALADKEFEDGAQSRTSRRKQRQTIRRRPYSQRGYGGFWPQPHN